MAFARVFGWNADVIEIEYVVVGFGVPENDFVPAAEAALVVQAMAEVPDDPVAQGQAVLPKYWVELNVERHYLAVVNVVANLPTDAARLSQARDDEVDDALLPDQVVFEGCFLLVGLAKVVWRRRYDQVEQRFGGQRGKQHLDVALPERVVTAHQGGQLVL